MATLSPGTMADDSGIGTEVWSDPDNAKVSDELYAIATNTTGTHTHYLKATKFGFTITTGAIINGILVEIQKRKNGGTRTVKDDVVSIVKADSSIGSENKGDTTTIWPNTEQYFSYGSSSDLWGETWNPVDINDDDFGVVISVLVATDTFAWIDHIRITVCYTPSGPSVSTSLSLSPSLSSSASLSPSTSRSPSLSLSPSSSPSASLSPSSSVSPSPEVLNFRIKTNSHPIGNTRNNTSIARGKTRQSIGSSRTIDRIGRIN